MVEHRCRLHTACGREDGGLHARRQIARRIHTRNAGLAGRRIHPHVAIVVEYDSQRTHQLDLSLRRMREEHLAREDATFPELDGLQSILSSNQARDGCRFESNACGTEMGLRLLRNVEASARENGEVTRPSA